MPLSHPPNTPQAADSTGWRDSSHLARIALPPVPWQDDVIRGVYISYLAIGQPEHRRTGIDLLNRTEINAVVIDVKGEDGQVSIPLALPWPTTLARHTQGPVILNNSCTCSKPTTCTQLRALFRSRVDLSRMPIRNGLLDESEEGYGTMTRKWHGQVPSPRLCRHTVLTYWCQRVGLYVSAPG